MKKIILIVLMVILVATPCFAQEVEPDGIFSLHGTVWQEYLWITIIPIPSIDIIDDVKYYFYDKRVYNRTHDNSATSWGFYVDLLAFSFSFHSEGLGYNEIGIWLPAVGINMGIRFSLYHGILPYLTIQIGNKIEDNWIPEETIDYLYLERGRQGETLEHVELNCSYTTFKSNPPVEISFVPPEGLTVSNIWVYVNDWICFDLDIAVDAPVGYRDVIVTYDNGKKIIEKENAFEVMP